MNLLALILINLKRITKKKTAVVLTFLLPAIVVFGISCVKALGPKNTREFYVTNNDIGIYGDKLVDILSKDFNVKLLSREDAMEKLKKKRIYEFYEIEEDFSEFLINGKSIDVVINRRESVQEFSDFEMKIKDAVRKLIISSHIEAISDEKMVFNSLYINVANVKVVSTTDINWTSQLKVNLLLSFVLFSSISMCFEFFSMKSERTIRRSLTTGNKPGMIIGGILGAQFIIVSIGYILIFLVNALFIDKELLPKVPIVICNIIALTLVSLSLAVLLTRIIKNEKMIIVTSQIVIVSICFLGGSFVPLEMLPESIISLSRFTPQFWAIESIRSDRYEYAIIVLLFAVALFTLGTWSVRGFVEDE